jgi:hypothetical protein
VFVREEGRGKGGREEEGGREGGREGASERGREGGRKGNSRCGIKGASIKHLCMYVCRLSCKHQACTFVCRRVEREREYAVCI